MSDDEVLSMKDVLTLANTYIYANFYLSNDPSYIVDVSLSSCGHLLSSCLVPCTGNVLAAHRSFPSHAGRQSGTQKTTVSGD